MCQHQPPCPAADATDRDAARVIATFCEQGGSLLCNGVILFEDTGELLPDGRAVPPQPRRGVSRSAGPVRALQPSAPAFAMAGAA